MLMFQIAIKVLSSEMDPAKIRLIRKVVIKERGAVFFFVNCKLRNETKRFNPNAQ